jgi:hypothetical protein
MIWGVVYSEKNINTVGGGGGVYLCFIGKYKSWPGIMRGYQQKNENREENIYMYRPPSKLCSVSFTEENNYIKNNNQESTATNKTSKKSYKQQ